MWKNFHHFLNLLLQNRDKLLIDELGKIKPQIGDQPVIHSPPRTGIKDPQLYEPILERLMRERERQNEEFSRRHPPPDHRGEYPFSQNMGMMEDLGQRTPRMRIPIQVPARDEEFQTKYEKRRPIEQERVQVPRQKTDVKTPTQASPTTQVKTKYEVDMYGRKKIDKSEKKDQNKYRQIHSSQPPPPQPPTGGGAGGHGGGGGGSDRDPSDSDGESDDESDDEEDEEDETSSTQEILPEDLPAELQGQRVFRRRINIRGRSRQQKQQGAPRREGSGGNSPSPSPPPSGAGPPRRRRRRRRSTWVYMIQGPAGPRGQDGRDGRDGVDAPPVTMPPPVQVTAPPISNLDTSALQNSFDQVGHNIANVLTEQRMTNYRLQEQMEANNETMQEQADAMLSLAEIAKKQSYDHMFAAIPYI